MHVLFICSQNVARSPTAEAIFRNEPGCEVSSAGTDPDAENPVSAESIEWADVVVVMEHHHRRSLQERFPAELKGRKLVVLDIPDNYNHMEPELIAKLRAAAWKWKAA